MTEIGDNAHIYPDKDGGWVGTISGDPLIGDAAALENNHGSYNAPPYIGAPVVISLDSDGKWMGRTSGPGSKYDWIPSYLEWTGNRSLVSSAYDPVNNIAYFYGGVSQKTSMSYQPGGGGNLIVDGFPGGQVYYEGGWFGINWPGSIGYNELWWVGTDGVWHHAPLEAPADWEYPIEDQTGGTQLYVLGGRLYLNGGLAAHSPGTLEFSTRLSSIPLGPSGPTSLQLSSYISAGGFRACSTCTPLNGDIVIIGGMTARGTARVFENYGQRFVGHYMTLYSCQCNAGWTYSAWEPIEIDGIPNGYNSRWQEPEQCVLITHNGTDFINICDSPPFGAPAYHQTVNLTIDGTETLFMIGGIDHTEIPKGVYKSVDGINWFFCSDLPNGNRYGHTSVVYEDKIYVIGGYQYNPSSDPAWSATNTVFFSLDGISWFEVVSDPNIADIFNEPFWPDHYQYNHAYLPFFPGNICPNPSIWNCAMGETTYPNYYCWYGARNWVVTYPHYFASTGVLAPDGSGIYMMGNGGPHAITPWNYSNFVTDTYELNQWNPWQWSWQVDVPLLKWLTRPCIVKWGKYEI